MASVSDEAMIEACERYLTDRHCTLWGSAFTIIDPKGRREAAEWLAAQIEGVLAISASEPSICPVSGTTPRPLHNGGYDYDGGFHHCQCGQVVPWQGKPWDGGTVSEHAIASATRRAPEPPPLVPLNGK
jgi:hypothetical protein